MIFPSQMPHYSFRGRAEQKGEHVVQF